METESYKIPEVSGYNLTDAKENIYRETPSTNYGIRYKFKIEYTKI